MERLAEAHLSSLIESTEDQIWSVDLDHRLILFNHAFQKKIAQNFGVRCEPGMKFETILPAPIAACWSSYFERAISQGAFRTEYETFDLRILEVVFSQIVYQGKLTGVSVFGKDITERRRIEIELRESEERFRATFEQAATGIVHCTFEGRLIRCNARFAEMLAYSQEEVPGLTVQAVTEPADLAESLNALGKIQRRELDTICLEKRFVRKDGTRKWAKLTISRQSDSAGRAVHFIAIVEDIDTRKATEDRLAITAAALKLSEERYRTAFQTSLDAISISRIRDGLYVDVNEMFLRIFGYERHEVLGHTAVELNIWADPSDRANFIEMLRHNSSSRDVEAKFRRKDGELFSVLISASPLEVSGVPYAHFVIRDLSDAKMAENAIRNLAFYDPLTRLPNRRLLLDRVRENLAAGVARGQKLALLLIDLDGLKTLNDTLGHKTGDLVLEEVAHRLVVCAQKPEAVARVGGDEFVIMLSDLSEDPEYAAEQATAAARRALSAIRADHLLNGHARSTDACIGITIFGDRHDDPNEVLRQAEIAVHHAKSAGRGVVRFFSPDLQAIVNARATIEAELREAIKTNQFVLYYQPQVRDSQLIGVEALLRWRHPNRGILPPDAFIPLAEESGLIGELGKWVLESACNQIAVWDRRAGSPKISVAINISVRQFRNEDFVEQVRGVLERTNADPQRLELEVTESVFADNIEDVVQKMTDLKALGLRFGLDDFGTGYSSLCYLKRLPLDQLKIDRSFVQDILTDATSGAIAQAIISLGAAMSLPVIAEGVESKEQSRFLEDLGCHLFQGYLFGRPMPIEDFESTWLSPQSSSEASCRDLPSPNPHPYDAPAYAMVMSAVRDPVRAELNP